MITGPTATGKSRTAYEIARRYDAEIVSCDSMQVYKHLDIGTAKPSKDQLGTVRHHLIDIVMPDEEFNVAIYKDEAVKAINDILGRNKLPVLAGGTGLYLNSLIFNLDLQGNKSDPEMRNELKEKSSPELMKMLENIDPGSAKQIHPNNIKRIIRAIEKAQDKISSINRNTFDHNSEPLFDFKIYALTMDRTRLYEKIDKRVDEMFAAGLINEVRTLVEKGLLISATALQAIGYKESVSFLKGDISYDDAVGLVKKNTRNYAKRQMTWLRRIKGITWIDIDKGNTDAIYAFIEDSGSCANK